MNLARIGIVPDISRRCTFGPVMLRTGAHRFRDGKPAGLLKKDRATHLNGQLRHNGSRLD